MKFPLPLRGRGQGEGDGRRKHTQKTRSTFNQPTSRKADATQTCQSGKAVLVRGPQSKVGRLQVSAPVLNRSVHRRLCVRRAKGSCRTRWAVPCGSSQV